MKALVTGSNGFIGREVCAELKRMGHKPVEFSASKGHDVTNRVHLAKAMKGCGAVIHCAAILSETLGYEKARSVNVGGTRNVLDAMEATGVKRLVHLSTVGVYGDNDNVMKEGTKWNPITTYEKTKAEAEELVWKRSKKLDITVVRPPIVYGNNPTWKKFFGIAGKSMPLVGSGKQEWQLVYVKDLARAIVMLLESRRAIGEDYIVASPERKSFREIMELCAEAQGKKYKPITLPAGLVEFASWLPYLAAKARGKDAFVIPSHVKRLVRNRKYDVRKILKSGWKPKYSLEEGLRETWKEMKCNTKNR